MISCYCQNVGGLRTRVKDIVGAVGLCDYTSIILLETWLTPEFSSAEVSFQGYTVYRSDRNVDTSDKHRGGGVLIAISNNLRSKLVIVDTGSVEQLFVEVRSSRKTLIIGAVYIPPRSSLEKYNAHCLAVQDVSERFPQADLTIFGDYNLPNATWSNEEMGVSVICPEDSPANVVAESFSYVGLFQKNHIPNSRGVFLDLLFSNLPLLSVANACDMLLPDSVHHYAYSFQIDYCNTGALLQFDELYYDFANADYFAINDVLASCDWDIIFGEFEVDVIVDKFYAIIMQCLDNFVPVKRVKSSNFPKWFSPELKDLILKKKGAHRRYLATQSAEDYVEFSRLRTLCKGHHDICYRRVIEETERNLTGNPRHFWRYINERRKHNSIPKCMHFEDSHAETGEDISNLFSVFFSGVYDPTVCPVPDFQPASYRDISISKFSLSDIFLKINSLPNKHSAGPDKISERFLKSCVYTISKPLLIIFNRSLDSGIFPKLWKYSYITPIFKSGDPEDVGNYRGVCNQSVIAKMFDSLVYDQFSWACKGIIGDCQFGFCKNRSTVDNLVLYEVALLGALENNVQIDAIYTDFSKAFDRVNFDILLAKLLAIGFAPHTVKWIESFLRGRTQSVKINNHVSSVFNVCSGVPQGSHCAPLLFNLFVNDICGRMQSTNVSLFADDLKMYKEVGCQKDMDDLQRDLDALWEWSCTNNLSLNIGKCSHISFFKGTKKFHNSYYINGNELKYVQEIKDLGVWFCESLSFNAHISRITLKGMRMLGFLIRSCGEFSIDTIRILYCALVRSNLEYAAVVWSPQYCNYSDMIERVQWKFLRFAAYKCGIRMENYHRSDMLTRLNLCSLEQRRLTYDMCYVFKLINGLIDCPQLVSLVQLNVPSRSLRRVELFSIPFHSTNYGMHSPVERTLRVFNTYKDQLTIFGCTPSGFKSRLHVLNTE